MPELLIFSFLYMVAEVKKSSSKRNSSKSSIIDFNQGKIRKQEEKGFSRLK